MPVLLAIHFFVYVKTTGHEGGKNTPRLWHCSTKMKGEAERFTLVGDASADSTPTIKQTHTLGTVLTMEYWLKNCIHLPLHRHWKGNLLVVALFYSMRTSTKKPTSPASPTNPSLHVFNSTLLSLTTESPLLWFSLLLTELVLKDLLFVFLLLMPSMG